EINDRIRELAARLPAHERDLRSQWVRAATSVCSNIAEAAQESRPSEKARIYRIARREIGEVNSCTADARTAHCLTEDEYEELTTLANRISAMLYRLVQRFSS
ncbi:MAG TPA: four helix bundle protein, partial [Longimicrobiales bacterium]